MIVMASGGVGDDDVQVGNFAESSMIAGHESPCGRLPSNGCCRDGLRRRGRVQARTRCHSGNPLFQNCSVSARDQDRRYQEQHVIYVIPFPPQSHFRKSISVRNFDHASSKPATPPSRHGCSVDELRKVLQFLPVA